MKHDPSILVGLAAFSVLLLLAPGCRSTGSGSEAEGARAQVSPAPRVPLVRPGVDPPRSGRDPATLPAPLPRTVDAAAVSGRTDPIVIDTSRFDPCIDRRTFEGRRHRPARFLPPHAKPAVDLNRPDNGLASGGIRPVARTTPDVAFPGIVQTPWSPPDPSIAVGPDHVLETVNMKIAWFDKDGTPQFEQFLDDTGDPGFFEEVGAGGFTFDPKCFYDPHAERYVVLALEYYGGAGEAWITFAVSDDDDPEGLWFKYRTWAVIESEGSEYWVDYPGFGYDEDAWYVTGNLFELSGGPGPGFLGGLVRVIDKTGALAGETVEWQDLVASGASWQVAHAPDPGQSTRIMRQSAGDRIEVARIVDPLGSPSLERAEVDVPTINADGDAPTPTGGGLWIVDPRIMNATIREDVLWLGNHGRRPNAEVASAAWYSIDCGPSVPTFLQGGVMSFEDEDEHTFFPALAVNGDGTAVLVYGRSGEALHPVLEATGRLVDDPEGSMGMPVRIAAGDTSPTGDGGPGGLNRWGDYFDATVDPTDDRTFWVVGMYQDADGWVTEIQSVLIDLRGDLDGDGAVNGGDLGLLLAAFGSDDPEADLNGDGTVDGGDLGLLLVDWLP